MNTIEAWLRQHVTVVLHGMVTTTLSGTLAAYDGTFLALEPDDGKPLVLIPLHAVLHLTLGGSTRPMAQIEG